MPFHSLYLVSVTSSTPIKAYNDFCLIPASYTCNQVDGSKPFFKKGYECKETSIEFILDANGILRHHCSGKKVCPEGTFDGAKIVLSSTCTDQQATFVRTPGTYFALNYFSRFMLFSMMSCYFVF